MNFPILKKSPVLWCETGGNSVYSALSLRTDPVVFQRGNDLCAGESITSVGIVLEGSVHIEIDDFWGSKIS